MNEDDLIVNLELINLLIPCLSMRIMTLPLTAKENAGGRPGSVRSVHNTPHPVFKFLTNHFYDV